MPKTPFDKKQVIADWITHFPYFGKYKPMWLLRRVGPVVFGIHLHQGSNKDKYLAVSHYHPLVMDFPTISLGGYRSVRNSGGAEWSCDMGGHNRSFSDISDSLVRESLYPLDAERISYDGFMDNIFEKYTGNKVYAYAITYSLHALICTGALIGRDTKNLIEKSIQLYQSVDIIPDNFSTIEAWTEDLHKCLKDLPALQAIVDKNIVDLKLTKSLLVILCN